MCGSNLTYYVHVPYLKWAHAQLFHEEASLIPYGPFGLEVRDVAVVGELRGGLESRTPRPQPFFFSYEKQLHNQMKFVAAFVVV